MLWSKIILEVDDLIKIKPMRSRHSCFSPNPSKCVTFEFQLSNSISPNRHGSMRYECIFEYMKEHPIFYPELENEGTFLLGVKFCVNNERYNFYHVVLKCVHEFSLFDLFHHFPYHQFLRIKNIVADFSSFLFLPL